MKVEENSKEDIMIVVGKVQIQKNEKDLYPVSYDMLIHEDISHLSPGIDISIEYGESRHWRPENPIRLEVLQIQDNGNVLVMLAHHRCSCCWDHALSYDKYCEIVADLFKSEVKSKQEFDYAEIKKEEDGQLYDIIFIETANGKFKDIEQRLHNKIEAILKPLFDFRDLMDAEVRNKFATYTGYKHNRPK